ncbi:MAG: BspA family leucine-rich repeat surface protein, partial [Streptococcaceae bacterium]|nr:BspA family leucine-rich repeat surface protein [Streptococcaceae bacterium]
MKKKSLIPIALLVTLLGGAEVYADGKNVITNFQLPIVHEMSTLSKAMLGKAEMGTWGGATWALADDGELIFVGGDVGTPPKNLHDTLIDNGIDISSVKSIEFTTKTQMSNVPNAFRDMASVTTIKKLGNLQYSGTGYFMFAMGTNNLTSLDLTRFNTSNFTDFNYMFSGDSGLTELDVSKFDTSKVIDLTGTFEAVTSVENLDVSNWDTSNVIRMNWTFSGMESVKKLDVSHWNTSKVYNMSMLFESCHSLTELDVSNWDMSAVDHMDYLFADMKNLRSLDLSNFKLFPNAVTGAMLAGDTSLSQLKLGPNFPLTSDMDLPNIPVSGDYTGYWQNVGSGTVDAPMGTNIWTSLELMTNYDGSQPDTYVWQKGSKMSLGQPSNYTTDLPLSTYVPTAVTPLKPYRYNVILNNDYPYYSSLIDGQMDSEHVTTPNFPVGHTVYNRATMPVIYTSG